ncbi:hypothetical protein CR513_12008, partial [Mucuna pruriens]
MENAKTVSTPLATHFKLSSRHSHSNEAKKTNMSKVPYASAMGSLMYAMMCTTPDIAYVVGTISRFLSNPSKEYYNAFKWILRYLHGTSDLRLCFGGLFDACKTTKNESISDKPTLVGYANLDMARDIDSKKSTSGYLIKFVGGAVTWQSKLHKCVVLSTTKGKFIVITKACKELIWVKKFLQKLVFLKTNAKLLELAKVHTDDNGVDMMTKPLPRRKVEACVRSSDWRSPPHSCDGGDMLSYFWAHNYVNKSLIPLSSLGLSYKRGRG